MNGKKWVAVVGGSLFAVASALIHAKVGGAQLQQALQIAVTVLGALGFAAAPPILVSNEEKNNGS